MHTPALCICASLELSQELLQQLCVAIMPPGQVCRWCWLCIYTILPVSTLLEPH